MIDKYNYYDAYITVAKLEMHPIKYFDWCGLLQIPASMFNEFVVIIPLQTS